MAAYIERDERCIFIGNLDSRVTEEILWELFLQVHMLVKGFKPCFIKPVSFTRALTFVKEIIQIGKCVQLNEFDRALKYTVNCCTGPWLINFARCFGGA